MTQPQQTPSFAWIRADYTRGALASALTAAFIALAPTAPAADAPAAAAPATAPAPASAPKTLTTATGTVVNMADGAPDHYAVKKGDTLWAISGMYLKDPWLWPQLWKVNPQIANPNLIYPGDEIYLTYVEGRPQLTVTRGGQAVATTGRTLPTGTVRLSPQIRTTPLDEAVSFVPIDAIRPFLSQTGIIDPDEADKAPYIFETVDGRVMAGAGDRVYVRKLPVGSASRFTVVRIGDTYVDPDSGDKLGSAAQYIGEAQVVQFGEPGIVLLSSSRLEALQGDRLVLTNLGLPNESFQPRPAKAKVNGRIIDVLGGASQIGQYHVVVINKGVKDGIQTSDLLAVMQSRGSADDKNAGFFHSSSVDLPDARAGEMMVFRTFQRVSYALMMHVQSEIHVGDKVTNP